MLCELHGRAVKRVGRRYFAVRVRPQSMADALHSQQQKRSDWYGRMDRPVGGRGFAKR